jgi:hypothetical protein
MQIEPQGKNIAVVEQNAGVARVNPTQNCLAGTTPPIARRQSKKDEYKAKALLDFAESVKGNYPPASTFYSQIVRISLDRFINRNMMWRKVGASGD